MIRRICLFGGPGSGKSTLALWLTQELRLQNNSKVELVDEHVKLWAYEGKKPTKWDQVKLFSKQLEKEEHFLRHGVDLIVTDSPLFMQMAYLERARHYTLSEILRDIAFEFDGDFPSINILVSRKGLAYMVNGRYEDHKQAEEMDKRIATSLSNNKVGYQVFSAINRTEIYNYVTSILNSNAQAITESRKRSE